MLNWSLRRTFALALPLTLLALVACSTPDSPPTAPQGEADLLGQTPVAPAPETAQPSTPLEQFGGRVPAPEFPPNVEWINVPAPLTMEALRGKVVLIDFWTYGCINCIHMLPVLAQLEEKYADELVIVSVHSAKFANEGETENIRQIVQRYNIHHPVVNDNQFQVWQAYGVRAWPSFALIDPRGMVLAIDAGELPFESFDRLIGGMVAAFDEVGEIDRRPIDLAPAGAGAPGTPLLFPGKVLADAAGERLFIADSNHHRLVVADLATYEVLAVIGSGQRGLADGSFEQAAFSQPQGMALDGDTLYVADTGNHAVRAVDLAARTVRTIAGTGEQGSGLSVPAPGGALIDNPTGYALRSPWDVALAPDGMLFIAMAGTHQLWVLNLDDNTLAPSVGNGREGLVDGPLAAAELAQPSGLHYADGLLVFADSESSSVRAVDLSAGVVRTLAGPLTNTLFDFGDVDGLPGVSRLQHPLGVAGAPDGTLYVADTYNNRIKAIDPATGETRTIFGLDASGFRDGAPHEAQLYEPGGLAYANGVLYIADTNNHAIRLLDLESSVLRTLTFPNPEALRMSEGVMVVGGSPSAGPRQALPEQAIAPGEGEVVLRLVLPEGFKVNDLIDSTVTFSAEGNVAQLPGADAAQVVDALEISVPAVFAEGSGVVLADLTLYYCREGEEALCFIDVVVIEAPIDVSAGASASAVVLERSVEPPVVPTGGF